MGEFTHSISAGFEFQEPESLVLRLKAGEEAAFTEVFDLYRDMIYLLSYRLLADKSEAMDVTQEVFLTLFKKIQQFRGDCTLKTWLYRVTLNHAANRNRWWNRRMRHSHFSLSFSPKRGNGQPKLTPVSRRVLPDRKLLSKEINSALQAGLESLPFEQRVAVVLRDVHDLTYDEISEIVGAHIGTVKSRIARGREKLKEHLEAFWAQGEA